MFQVVYFALIRAVCGYDAARIGVFDGHDQREAEEETVETR